MSKNIIHAALYTALAVAHFDHLAVAMLYAAIGLLCFWKKK
jgi:hypothetical protein